jgi:uracil-DNA glycosylase
MDSWKNKIPNFKAIVDPIRLKVKAEREKGPVYPDPADIMKAFMLTSFEDTRIVILGPAPYINGNADGLAYSSKAGFETEQEIIFKEIAANFGVPNCGYSWQEYFPTYSLETWAKRGILLLNIALTCNKEDRCAHADLGWDKLITAVLEALNKECRPIVFLLWGNLAQTFKSVLNNPKHLVLESGAPIGNHFAGNQHFLKASSFLAKQGGINTISLRKHFNFKSAHEEIQKLAMERKWTPKFTKELTEELDASNFYMNLDESIHLFSTNTNPL